MRILTTRVLINPNYRIALSDKMSLRIFCSFLLCIPFLVSCAAQVDKLRSGDFSKSQVVVIEDEKLTTAAIVFLANSDTANSRNGKYRERFAAALSEYLQGNELPNSTILKVERDGMTFMLPIQFINADSLDTRSYLSLTQPQSENVSAQFKGEILDLLWYSGNNDRPEQVIALFADSLVALSWPISESSDSRTLHFVRDDLDSVRTAYPAGMLRLADTNDNEVEAVQVWTSNLSQPLLVVPDKHQLNVEDMENTSKKTNGLSGSVQPGNGLFYSSHSDEPSRSLRVTNAGHIVRLDSLGYLHLHTKETPQPIWSSTRSWGNRLFILDNDLIAVCDGRQSAFVGFEIKDGELRLLGQSAEFQGAVSAIGAVHHKKNNGLLVSTVTEQENDTPVSRLHFLSNEDVVWRLPVEYDQPKFPLNDGHLTFILSDMPSNRPGNPHQALPLTIWENSYQTLFKAGKSKPVPVLIQLTEADSARRIWEFQLRPNIRFADGSVVTAEDVLESWTRNSLICEQTKCTSRWLWSDIFGADEFLQGSEASIAGIEIKDRYSLKIRLNETRPDFPEQLTQPCFAVMKFVDNEQALGTGPFQVEDLKDQNATAFLARRNRYYYDGQPLLQDINFLIRANIIDTLMNNANAGAIIRHRKELEYFSKVEDVQLHSFPVERVYFLALNPEKGPLSSLDHRKEIGALLEKEILASVIKEAEISGAEDFLNSATHDTVDVAPKTDSVSFSRALKIAFRAADPVARQIAERLSVRMSQVKIPCQNPQALPEAAFEKLIEKKGYDILVDSYAPVFTTAAYNLGQLLHIGYAVPAPVFSALDSVLASGSAEEAILLQGDLIAQAILFPVIRAKNYAVMHVSLNGVDVAGEKTIDFSGAWISKTERTKP